MIVISTIHTRKIKEPLQTHTQRKRPRETLAMHATRAVDLASQIRQRRRQVLRFAPAAGDGSQRGLVLEDQRPLLGQARDCLDLV